MSFFIIRRDPLDRQPGRGEFYEIDKSNPLTSDLHLVWWPGLKQNPIDGRPYTYSSGYEIDVRPGFGKWPAMPAQIAGASRYVDLGPVPNTIISYVCLLDKRADNNSFGFSTRSGSTAGFELLFTNTTEVSLRVTGNSQSSYGTGLNNQVRLYGGTLWGTAFEWFNRETYLDGVFKNNATGNVSAAHTQNLYLFRRGTTYASTCDIRFFALKRARWTESDHQRLAANPFQILI